MTKTPKLTRQEALDELKRYGITGSQIYLIDIIPLLEMIWADGKPQDGEVAILEDYLEKHVIHINELANCELLTLEGARSFVLQFLRKRPDTELLKTLRSLVAPVRLSSSDTAENNALRESLLAACLDIVSSSVIEYPYRLGERFNPAEKRCFFEILESL